MLRAVVVLATWANVAQLWPPNMPESTMEWFSRQKSTHGYCCSKADGVPADWELRNGQYWVLDTISGVVAEWRAVPDDALIRGETNPTGRAVVWYMAGDDTNGKRGIRCFIPGPEI